MMPNVNQPNWFPQTKLYPPQVGRQVLHRPRLLEAIYQAITTHRLILLSAPAGAGKTTAIASIYHDYPKLPLAWLTLDEQDNDTLTFFRAVLAAIRRCLPGCGQTLQMVLDTPAAANIKPQRLMTLLINDIVEQSPEILVLVLDDLHRVSDPGVQRALDYLLDNLPPSLRLVVTTRSDPPLHLSRLRARRELAEFRMEALRFSEAELRALFSEVLHLSLSSEELARLQKRTEGWAAGVCLLTLSLSQLDATRQRANLLQHLSQNQRFLFDYLLDEVLNQLEPDVRMFLLQTSILAELTSTLCNAVTQRTDSARVLDQLYRQNLFLVVNEATATQPLAEPTYRYHALFTQFLQRQLHQNYPQQLAELHRRAAKAQPKLAQKIYHYLQARLWPEAVEHITQVARTELDQGFLRPATQRWVAALPTEVHDTEPWLQLFSAAYLVQTGALEQGFARLQESLATFRRQGDEAGEFACLNRMLMSRTALVEEAEAFYAAHPHLPQPYHRAWLLLAHCWRDLYLGEWDQVGHYLRQLLPLLRDNASLHYFFATSFGPQFVFVEHGLTDIEALAEALLQQYGDGVSLVHCGIYNRLATVRFYQARLDEALTYARRAEHIVDIFGGLAWQHVTSDHVHLFAYLIRGDYATFHARFEQRWPDIQANESLAVALAHYLYLKGCAFWHEQRLAEMRHTLLEIEQVDQRQSWYRAPHQKATNLLRAWLHLADGDFARSEQVLQRAVARHATERETLLSSHPRLNLACLYWLWAQAERDEPHRQAAFRELEHMLDEAAARNLPGLLLQSGRAVIPLLQAAESRSGHPDIIAQVLAAFGEDDVVQPLAVPGTGNTLTPREVEVLHLLMTGASNKEIAAQLVVTPRTVKAHVSAILQKLQVSSRTEAVARAHALSLL